MPLFEHFAAFKSTKLTWNFYFVSPSVLGSLQMTTTVAPEGNLPTCLFLNSSACPVFSSVLYLSLEFEASALRKKYNFETPTPHFLLMTYVEVSEIQSWDVETVGSITW